MKEAREEVGENAKRKILWQRKIVKSTMKWNLWRKPMTYVWRNDVEESEYEDIMKEYNEEMEKK